MSFIKAFGFSIIAFIGLNVAFFFIGYGIDGSLSLYFESLASTPTNILYMLLGPIYGMGFPYVILSQFSAFVIGVIPIESNIGMLIVFIGYIVSPVVAAILSGKFGDNKTQSFLGWFATAIISCIIVMIVVVIEMISLGIPIPLEAVIAQIMLIAGIGVIYGLLYGSFALLMPD